jgi:hypothetical protein
MLCRTRPAASYMADVVERIVPAEPSALRGTPTTVVTVIARLTRRSMPLTCPACLERVCVQSCRLPERCGYLVLIACRWSS